MRMPAVLSKFYSETRRIGFRHLQHQLNFGNKLTKTELRSAIHAYKRSKCPESNLKYTLKQQKGVCIGDLVFLVPDAIDNPPKYLDRRLNNAISHYAQHGINTVVPVDWIADLVDRQLEIDEQRKRADYDFARRTFVSIKENA